MPIGFVARKLLSLFKDLLLVPIVSQIQSPHKYEGDYRHYREDTEKKDEK